MPDRRTAPLISAKHAIPPPRATWVRRPRLHRPLCDSAARLTVVVAPAGWGKTTLLTQWAHDPAETRGIVWVSLDDADSDPVRFWTYVLSALQRDVIGVSGAPLAALLTAGLAPVDLALPTLLNELTVLDSAHVLVLDDYHLIDHDDVHESVEYLLAYLPATLRVVIASRSDPRLPLARMRVRGELAELRAADLGFSTEEGAELLNAAGVDATTAAALWERTEGWAAGLQLAALTFDAAQQPEAAAAALRGDDRHILDYLSTEVLDRLPADHQDLLVRTAVLERISGPLCDAVLDRAGSAAVLSELDHANLFVAPLDPRREWYRCHRLFRDTLLHRLEARDPAEAGRVRLRAADWFLQRDYVAEAVGLRIDAGDADGAAGLLRSRVPFFLETGALSTHLHLGRQLPASRVSRDPGLCVALAWAAGLNGQFSRMRSWLDAAEPLIHADSPTLDGWRTLRGRRPRFAPSKSGSCGPTRHRLSPRPPWPSSWSVIRTWRATWWRGPSSARCSASRTVPTRRSPTSTTRGLALRRSACRPSWGCRPPASWPRHCSRPITSTGSAAFSPRSVPRSGPRRTRGSAPLPPASRGCGPSRADSPIGTASSARLARCCGTRSSSPVPSAKPRASSPR